MQHADMCSRACRWLYHSDGRCTNSITGEKVDTGMAWCGNNNLGMISCPLLSAQFGFGCPHACICVATACKYGIARALLFAHAACLCVYLHVQHVTTGVTVCYESATVTFYRDKKLVHIFGQLLLPTYAFIEIGVCVCVCVCVCVSLCACV
jgi:hypothetical protein